MNIDKLCLYCMNEKAKGTQLCEHCGHTPEDCRGKAHQLEPYTILNGQYLIGRVLGEGGFGITYLGFDLLNEKKVAVKEMYISGRVRRYSRGISIPGGVRGYSRGISISGRAKDYSHGTSISKTGNNYSRC